MQGDMTTMTACSEFTRLTTPHLPRLHRLGMRLTRQESDSADLVQEALTRAWANWGRFKEGGSLGAWLSRILMNTFISRVRHDKVVRQTGARFDLTGHIYDGGRLQAAASPETMWQRESLPDEVVRALAELPEAYRDVVEAVDLEGLDYRSAAERLGVPVGTVMSRLHRGRRRLRIALADYAATRGIAAN